MVNCMYCGQLNGETAFVCQRCGAQTEFSRNYNVLMSRSKGAQIEAIVFAVIAVIGWVMYYQTKHNIWEAFSDNWETKLYIFMGMGILGPILSLAALFDSSRLRNKALNLQYRFAPMNAPQQTQGQQPVMPQQMMYQQPVVPQQQMMYQQPVMPQQRPMYQQQVMPQQSAMSQQPLMPQQQVMPQQSVPAPSDQEKK